LIIVRKVGLLGGTFDPIHQGHLIIADQVLWKLSLDEVRFMPNALPPHKRKTTTTSIEDRLKMIELAIQDHPKFRIETIELMREGKSFTYDTMVLLKEREPDTEFYFIIGGDMIDDLPNWHRIDELLTLVTFVGVNRPGFKGETEYPLIRVEIPLIAISSSLIRDKIKRGESIRYLVPDEVIRFIKEHHLYET